MNQEEGLILVSQIAMLVEQFERRCELAGQEMRQLAQQVPGLVKQSADEQLQRLPSAVLNQVQGGLERSVSSYEQRLQTASQSLHGASQTLAAQLKRMEYLHKQLIWKVLGVALCSLLLLLAGGGWLMWQYRNDIHANQLSRDLLRAYNQADVTLCDGRLCAKVDKAGRYGDYLLVKPR